jgi:hypothetical protein
MAKVNEIRQKRAKMRVERDTLIRALAVARSMVVGARIRLASNHRELQAARNRVKDAAPRSRERRAARATVASLWAQRKVILAEERTAARAVTKALAAARTCKRAYAALADDVI